MALLIQRTVPVQFDFTRLATDASPVLRGRVGDAAGRRRRVYVYAGRVVVFVLAKVDPHGSVIVVW